MQILVTGGAGYIGSHIVHDLLLAGHEVMIVDDFSNSDPETISKIAELTGLGDKAPLKVKRLDVCNTPSLMNLLRQVKPAAVIHLAGLKNVAQSFQEPERYLAANFGGTQSLLSAMVECNCDRLIFSSSAAVYGDPNYLPVDEAHPLAPMSPYGQSKLRAEQLIADWAAGHANRRGLALRYFNPVGCLSDPARGVSLPSGCDALMNQLVKVASGEVSHLDLFGTDYDTPDGTCLRDFFHVRDLAQGHIAALNALEERVSGFLPINLGRRLRVPATCWAGKRVSTTPTCAGRPGRDIRALPRSVSPGRSEPERHRVFDGDMGTVINVVVAPVQNADRKAQRSLAKFDSIHEHAQNCACLRVEFLGIHPFKTIGIPVGFVTCAQLHIAPLVSCVILAEPVEI